jgi:hypothetical protein
MPKLKNKVATISPSLSISICINNLFGNQFPKTNGEQKMGSIIFLALLELTLGTAHPDRAKQNLTEIQLMAVRHGKKQSTRIVLGLSPTLQVTLSRLKSWLRGDAMRSVRLVIVCSFPLVGPVCSWTIRSVSIACIRWKL